MEKNVNIVNNKINELEMDISIDGYDVGNDKDIICKFVIKTKDIDFSLNCEHSSDNIWKIKVPVLPIEYSLYDFCVYMVIDGYYYEVYNGTINVLKPNEVYFKDVSNTTFVPKDTSDVKVDTSVEPKNESKSITKSNDIKTSHKTDSLLKQSILNNSPKLSDKERKLRNILGVFN